MPSITVDGVNYELPPNDGLGSKVPLYNPALMALAGYLANATAAWTAYTPTVTTGTGTITTLGTVTGRYKRFGKTIFFQVRIPITTNGTGATDVRATLPVSPAAAFEFTVQGIELLTGKTLRGYIGTSATLMNIRFYDAAYPGADGNTLVVSGVYEAA